MATANARPVTVDYAPDPVVVSGFRLTGGAPDGDPFGDYGGGVLCLGSQLTVGNCEIDGNQSGVTANGGGVSARYGSFIVLRDNFIHHNTAPTVGAGVMINDPAGAYNNRKFFSPIVDIPDSLDPVLLDIFFDPQTSGGLLICIDRDSVDDLLGKLKEKGISDAAVIGKVVDQPKEKIAVR